MRNNNFGADIAGNFSSGLEAGTKLRQGVQSALFRRQLRKLEDNLPENATPDQLNQFDRQQRALIAKFDQGPITTLTEQRAREQQRTAASQIQQGDPAGGASALTTAAVTRGDPTAANAAVDQGRLAVQANLTRLGDISVQTATLLNQAMLDGTPDAEALKDRLEQSSSILFNTVGDSLGGRFAGALVQVSPSNGSVHVSNKDGQELIRFDNLEQFSTSVKNFTADPTGFVQGEIARASAETQAAASMAAKLDAARLKFAGEAALKLAESNPGLSKDAIARSISTASAANWQNITPAEAGVEVESFSAPQSVWRTDDGTIVVMRTGGLDVEDSGTTSPDGIRFFTPTQTGELQAIDPASLRVKGLDTEALSVLAAGDIAAQREGKFNQVRDAINLVNAEAERQRASIARPRPAFAPVQRATETQQGIADNNLLGLSEPDGRRATFNSLQTNISVATNRIKEGVSAGTVSPTVESMVAALTSGSPQSQSIIDAVSRALEVAPNEPLDGVLTDPNVLANVLANVALATNGAEGNRALSGVGNKAVFDAVRQGLGIPPATRRSALGGARTSATTATPATPVAEQPVVKPAAPPDRLVQIADEIADLRRKAQELAGTNSGGALLGFGTAATKETNRLQSFIAGKIRQLQKEAAAERSAREAKAAADAAEAQRQRRLQIAQELGA